MPRPIGAPSPVGSGRTARVGALVRAGLPVPLGFVVAQAECVDALAVAHLVDEAGGFPVVVFSDTAAYGAASASELVHRIADARSTGCDVMVQRSLVFDLVGTATSVDASAGDDEVVLVDLVPAGAPAATVASKIRIRKSLGVVIERQLVDVRTNLSDRLAQLLVDAVVGLETDLGHPVAVDWAADDQGSLWFLDLHEAPIPRPALGWVRTEVPGAPVGRALVTAGFDRLVRDSLLRATPEFRCCAGNLSWPSAAFPGTADVGPAGSLLRHRRRRALHVGLGLLGAAQSATKHRFTDGEGSKPAECAAHRAELNEAFAFASSLVLLFPLIEGEAFAAPATSALFDAVVSATSATGGAAPLLPPEIAPTWRRRLGRWGIHVAGKPQGDFDFAAAFLRETAFRIGQASGALGDDAATATRPTEPSATPAETP